MKSKNNYIINVIQNLYIVFFNNTYKISSRINEKNREKIIFLSFFAFSGLLMFYRATSNEKWFNGVEREIIFILGMIVVCLFSVKGELNRIKWNPFIVVPYYTLGLLMLISTFVHDNETDYQLFIISILIIFPAIHFIWGNRGDYETLLRLMCKAFCYSGLIIVIAGLVFYPPESDYIHYGNYTSFTKNPNGFAGAIMAIAVSAVYLYIIAKTKKEKIVPIITIIFTFTVNLMTDCRTTIYSYFALILVALFICIIRYIDEKKNDNVILKRLSQKKLKRYMFAVLIGIIFLIIAVLVTIFYNAATTLFNGGYTTLFDIFNKISTGRFEIWKFYFENSTWMGNDVGSTVNVNGREFVGAHNSLLDFIYRSGFIVGIIYMWLWITAIIFTLKQYIKQRGEKELFAILLLPVFIIMTTLEASYTSAYVGIVCFAYISLGFLFNSSSSRSLKQIK